MSERRVRLAVAGAGLIGLRHIEAIGRCRELDLVAIADPSHAAKGHAEDAGVTWAPSLDDLLATPGIDGVILAIPNQLHTVEAIKCIAAGIPVLVEKPLADTVAGGLQLVRAADEAGVPLLVGHHRRHNDLIRKAQQIVASGDLGQLASVQAQTWFAKPDRYFEADWRRRPGAGPVFLNLIHDIDLMHALCGAVEAVHAMESNALRGNEVEETAVILLRFASGVLGTMNLCDAAAAPWSWEMTSRENPGYPATPESCYWLGGTKGSLALPNLALWAHQGENGWWSPITCTRPLHDFVDPLVRQVRHFGAVIRGEAEPLVSGADGLAALEVVEAIKRSARSGQTVEIRHLTQ